MWKRSIRWTILIALAGISLVAATASARSVWRPEPRRAFSVRLETDAGEELRTFQHRGTNFVLAQFGQRYGIRVSNPTSRRVEAVISVDGRDAISGGVADFVRHRGYVIPPFGSIVVDGFRQSHDVVAAFRFGSAMSSYSARRGTPENVGIVGVAFFAERDRVPVEIARKGRRSAPAARDSAAPRERPTQSRRAPSSSERSAGKSSNNVGTEFGENRFSSVVEVTFERAAPERPTQIVSIRYDDAEGLAARGIQLPRPLFRSDVGLDEPRAFPNTSFAAPP